jgi:hypothetical protein
MIIVRAQWRSSIVDVWHAKSWVCAKWRRLAVLQPCMGGSMKPPLHLGGNEPFGYLKVDLLFCYTLKQTFANFLKRCAWQILCPFLHCFSFLLLLHLWGFCFISKSPTWFSLVPQVAIGAKDCLLSAWWLGDLPSHIQNPPRFSSFRPIFLLL